MKIIFQYLLSIFHFILVNLHVKIFNQLFHMSSYALEVKVPLTLPPMITWCKKASIKASSITLLYRTSLLRSPPFFFDILPML